MPQTSKKQKDTYPTSNPPAKVNQRTGDIASGQSKQLTRLANNRSANSVLRNAEISAIKDLPNKAYYGEYGKDLRNIPRTEAYYEEINPFRKFKLNADTVYKDLVRSNQATDPIKLPKSNKTSQKPMETAAKTAVSTSVLASPAAKGLGTLGAMIASQKGAGMSPRDENDAVAKWNKETNYGRLLGIKK
jgi:hypothetical protein